MIRVRVGLMCVLVAAVASSAHAQTAQDPWSVTVEYLSIDTRGNDVHVGDVFTEHQTLSGTATSNRLDYGVTYDPIRTNLERNQSGMVTAAYRRQRWQFGGRWWRVAPEAETTGSRSTTPATASSQFVTGIRMWENSQVPVINQQHPSGISPVTFRASNQLEHMVIDGYAALNWIQETNLNVAIRLGAAYAQSENTRSEGQTMRAFVTQTGPGITTTLENNITIGSESESTNRLLGPMLALAGDTTLGRVRIEWLAGHSLMIGTAATSGTWTDIDNIREVTVTSSAITETLTVLDGVIPVENEERPVVPVIELQVRAGVRVARRVHVGGGLFSSTWLNLPVAPAFVVPDDWTDIQGTGWRAQTRNVSFTGFTIFAAVGF